MYCVGAERRDGPRRVVASARESEGVVMDTTVELRRCSRQHYDAAAGASVPAAVAAVTAGSPAYFFLSFPA